MALQVFDILPGPWVHGSIVQHLFSAICVPVAFERCEVEFIQSASLCMFVCLLAVANVA